MNKSFSVLFLALSLFGATSAVAAPNVVLGTDTILAGETASIPLTFQADGVVRAFDFRFTFDNTQFTATPACVSSIDTTGAANAGVACAVVGNEVRVFVSAAAEFPVPAITSGDRSLGSVSFLSLGSTPAAGYALNITQQNYFDGAGDSVTPTSSTNGNITVSPGPQPSFSSNPAPGAGVTVPSVIKNDTDTSANVVISNVGEGGSTLTGTCSETSDPDAVFSLSGDTNFSVLQGATDTVTVTCDSAGEIGPHSGTMQCTHDGVGGLTSPQDYSLSCTITAGPQPAYSSNPAAGNPIAFADTEAGDPNPPNQSVTITNTGDPSTTLTGTCAMDGGSDTQITLVGAGGFSIAQGAAGSVKTVACDASVQGLYTGTLSCSHNGSAPSSPVNYAVSCNVTEAGAAIFASSPVPGPIDVDGGADVVVDDTDPTSVLTFFNNADQGDQNLGIECSLSGDAAITVQPNIAAGITIAPKGSSQVTFSCDTAGAGNFTATYSCLHQSAGVDQPAGNPPNAVYNLTCEVREPAAEVEITPAPGTPQTKSVPPGGSTSFSFDFTEVNDEGLDGSVVSCSVGGGQGFSVNSTPTLPADVLSGETLTVVVDFADPTGAESWSDTLTCMFGDTDDDDTEVSWLLTVNIGGDARFTVLKDFTDDNPGEVTVDLDCDTGLILDQSKTITEDGIGVTFVVTDFDAGDLNCNVTERPVAGYITEFDSAGSDSASTDSSDSDDGCFYTLIDGGDENSCVITNTPDDVVVKITKEWVYPGSADASAVSDDFTFVLYCSNASIVGGSKIGDKLADSPSAYLDSCAYSYGDKPKSASYDEYCKTLNYSGNKTFFEKVNPYVWPGGSCYVEEIDVDPAVEVDNGCGSLEVSAGSGDSCTITNTVFFEGIPTLSQYGMALMALLMLGMGFVAVRRIV